MVKKYMAEVAEMAKIMQCQFCQFGGVPAISATSASAYFIETDKTDMKKRRYLQMSKIFRNFARKMRAGAKMI